MQMQSTYWLQKVLKMTSLYVNALLCTLQHIVMHAMQLSGVMTLTRGKRISRKRHPTSSARDVRKISSHFEYLENRSRGLDVTWLPVRGDLTAQPRTVTLPWG